MTRIKALALGLVFALAASGSAQSADEMLRTRLAAPSDPLGYYDKSGEGIRLYFDRKYEESAKTLRSAIDQYPLDGLLWLYLGMALHYGGHSKESIAPLLQAEKLRNKLPDWFVDYVLAEAYLGAGDKENSYKRLEELVFDDKYAGRPRIFDDDAFASLREEPRFLKLVGRVDASKMSRTEGWRTDVDYLISEIKRVNHRYSVRPLPAEVLKRREQLKRDVPKLTDEQIYMRMGHMLAPLNQGHVSLALFKETKLSPFRALPMQLYAFPEGVFVVKADEKHKDLEGAQIVKIEDTPTPEVLQKIEQHNSVENPMKIIWGVQNLALLPALKGLGVLPAMVQDVRLTLRMPDGQSVTRVVPSTTDEQNRKLVPAPKVTPPLFLKDVANVHWFEPLPEHDAIFVQLNQVRNAPNETLEQFGLKLRKQLEEKPAKNLILDVRHNNGGGTGLYPEFLRTLIAHTTKEGNRLYVIIGRGVYSATGNLISDLERLGKPIFVGEPSSGFGNQDGDESFTILPYSGIRGFLTSVWWQLSTPWDRRTSIVPDIPVQMTAKDYFEGRDPVLEKIFEDIKRPARPLVPEHP